ncbi:hypothetical protein TRSC58_02123 [Trypanosoma rangeli SC58]|uniref:PPIase cyclophilin-type domain-containing protein n=1 Tax=Trypanosoma rangeli SC58 TaxID=429131 RepID=A0A061J3Z5_TRYRA|nr:hypothetical protein TRSC58_02123 [Trypanosoma rangeli SC58]
MHATFNFRFPNRQKQKGPRDVVVRVLVPAPAQRPKAVLNFFFMCTGQLPSGEALDMCGVASDELSALSTGSVSQISGLKPFAESAVVRIEKDVMMEIGSSTTKTIFGGFIADEPSRETTPRPAAVSSSPTASSAHPAMAARMRQLCAGALLIGNVGMPNTNGSRYYILLQDVVTEAQREELSVYQPLGIVTAGLEALREACASAAVQPRTLAPLEAVKMWVSEVCFQPQVAAPTPQMDRQPEEATVAARERRDGRERVAVTRMAGRARRRDEVEMEEQDEASARDAETGGSSTTAAHGGFFNPALSFPAPADGQNRDRNGPQAKRMRTERYMTAVDGTTVLRTTAVEQADGAPFDYFAAQESAFLNDVEAIAATQAARRQNRGKQQGQKTQKKKRPVGNVGLGRTLNAGRNTKGLQNASLAKKKKSLPRRY